MRKKRKPRTYTEPPLKKTANTLPPAYKPPFRELTPADHDMRDGAALALAGRR